MGYTDKIRATGNLPVISSETFLNIAFGNDASYIRDRRYIDIKDCIVSDDVIFTGGNIYRYVLNIKNVYFEKMCSFFDSEFKEFVTLEECFFDQSILFSNAIFKKTLTIKMSHCTGNLMISSGEFADIKVSFYDLEKIYLTGGKFNLFNIGEYIGGDKIDAVAIINENNELGNISIKGLSINKIFLSGNNEKKNILIENCKTNLLNINNFKTDGNLKLINIVGYNTDEFISAFSIIKSNFGKSEFYRIDFSSFSEFNVIDSNIIDCIFTNVNWKNVITAFQSPDTLPIAKSKKRPKETISEILNIKETYRQLKFAMQKQGNVIQEMKFHANEMNVYNKILKWNWPWTNEFYDKLILYASNAFSRYGQSFIRPIISLLAFHFVLFFILIYWFSYKGIEVVSFGNSNSEMVKFTIGEYFRLLNPTHKFDDILSGWEIFWDLMIRASSAYFIFLIIRATRKFVKGT